MDAADTSSVLEPPVMPDALANLPLGVTVPALTVPGSPDPALPSSSAAAAGSVAQAESKTPIVQPVPAPPPLKSQQSMNAASPLDIADIATAARLAGQRPQNDAASAAGTPGTAATSQPSSNVGDRASTPERERRNSFAGLGLLGSSPLGSRLGRTSPLASSPLGTRLGRTSPVGISPPQQIGESDRSSSPSYVPGSLKGEGGFLGSDDPVVAAKRAALRQKTAKPVNISDLVKQAKAEATSKETVATAAAVKRAAAPGVATMKKTNPEKCVASGDGLQTGMTRQLSSFSIEARDEEGKRRKTGGDVFLVTARGASVVKVHVTDHNNGLYTCEWRPSVSGQYYISCSLHGTSLPNSPFCINVLAPTSDPEKCVLSGDALSWITARDVSSFQVEFVDALGQPTHAEELDVFVMPREPGPPLPTAEELAEEERKAQEEESQRQQQMESERKRAAAKEAARIEEEKINASRRPTKRRSAAQKADIEAIQAFGKEVTKKAKDTEKIYGVGSSADATAANAVAAPATAPAAAPAAAPIAAPAADPVSALATAAAAPASAPAAGLAMETEKPRASARTSPAGSARLSARSGEGSARRRQQSPLGTPKDRSGVVAGAPATAPAAASSTPKGSARTGSTTPKGSARVNVPAGQAMAPAADAVPSSAAGPSTKTLEESNGSEAAPTTIPAESPDATSSAANKDSVVEDASVPADDPTPPEGVQAEAAQASQASAPSTAPQSRRSKPLSGGSRSSRRASPLGVRRDPSSRNPPQPRPRSNSPERGPENGGPNLAFDDALAAAVSVGRAAPPSAAAAAATGHISPPRSRMLKPEKEMHLISPKHPKGFNPNHPTHPKLDGGDRQKHMRLWQKQLADEQSRLKTERHVRELLREKYGEGKDAFADAELRAAAAGPSFASEIGLEEPTRPGSPRKLSDGFAYGGVYPGTIHAKGQIVKSHTVSYAIGRAGTYWLHVGLRSSSLPLPGSPFQLTVHPGHAHALSSRIPANVLPLRTVVGEVGKLILHAADRMGNLCHKGGDPLQAAEPTGQVKCKTNDLGDGRYEFEWKAEISGTYFLHISVAGSLLYGSPAELIMSPAAPAVKNCEVAGTGLHRALAGRHAYLRIKSKDRFSNPTLPGLSMSFGLCIIPAVKQTFAPPPKVMISEEENHEPGAPEPAATIEKPLYSDEEIYGVTKAEALERFKRAEEEKRLAAEQAKLAEQMRKEEAANAPSTDEASAPAPAPAQEAAGRRGSLKGNAPPVPIVPPPDQPKPKAPSGKKGSDEKASKQKAAAEKRAAEAAAAEKEAAKAAKRKEEEERLLKEREMASKAKPATVQSIDFEGAWRTGGEYEIRYMAKEAGNFALHIWCDLEGNGERHRLPGSPFHLLVSPAAPSPKGSTVEMYDRNIYTAGDTLELRPQLRDAFGNPTELMDKSQRMTSDQSSMKETIMKELMTQHGLQFTPPRVLGGMDRLQSTSGTSAPNKLRRGQRDPAQLVASETGMTRPNSFGDESLSSTPFLQSTRVVSSTPFQKRRGSLGLGMGMKKDVSQELTSWLVGPKGTVNVSLRKVPGSIGLYVIDDHAVTVSGQYEAHFALNGVPISGSPYQFQVKPAEGFGRNSYIVSPEQPAYVKLPYELTLHAVDRYGNKLTSGGSKVEGKVIGANASACTVVDHKDGTYSLHFTVNATGSYNVEVRIDGAKVKGKAGAIHNYTEAAEAERKAAKQAKAAAAKEARRLSKEAEAEKKRLSKESFDGFAAAPAAEASAPAPADAGAASRGPPVDISDLTATI